MQRHILFSFLSSLTSAANGFSTCSLSGDLKAPGNAIKQLFNMVVLYSSPKTCLRVLLSSSTSSVYFDSCYPDVGML